MLQKRLTELLWIFLLLTSTVTGDGDEDTVYHEKWDEKEIVIETLKDEDIFFEILDPPELEYTYRLRPAKDFGVPFNESFFEKLIPLIPVLPATCCENPSNADELNGNVALIERGNCTFFQKSMIAEEAGAKAVIISDYNPASLEESITSPIWADYYYIDMIRDDNIFPAKSVNIPVGFLLGKNGKIIRNTLKQLKKPFALINIPVNLTYTPLEKIHQPPWLSWLYLN